MRSAQLPPLSVQRLRALLRAAGGFWRVEFKPETGSTSDDARKALESASVAGTAFLTDFQTAGRGARGRRWLAPPRSSLLMSAVLDVANVSKPFVFTQLGALALCTGLRESTGLDVRIKWPNDAVVGLRKIGGALVEVVETGAGRVAIVGLGANLNFRSDEIGPVETPATSVLDETGSPCNREAVACAVLSELARRLGRIGEQAAFTSEWEALSAVKGERVEVRTERRTVRGRVRGFGPEGELILQADDGSQSRFWAGRVSVRQTAGEPGNPGS